MGDGREHLRRAHVGPGKHAHLAVGVGQRGDPLHGVVAVVGLVFEGIPLTLGGVAAAHILHNHQVATRGSLAGEVGGAVLVVGCALEQRWVFALAGWAVDVGTQGDAVAGLHGDALLDHDLDRRRGGHGSSLAQGGDGGLKGEGEGEKAKSLFQQENPPAAMADTILLTRAGHLKRRKKRRPRGMVAIPGKATAKRNRVAAQ